MVAGQLGGDLLRRHNASSLQGEENFLWQRWQEGTPGRGSESPLRWKGVEWWVFHVGSREGDLKGCGCQKPGVCSGHGLQDHRLDPHSGTMPNAHGHGGKVLNSGERGSLKQGR